MKFKAILVLAAVSVSTLAFAQEAKKKMGVLREGETGTVDCESMSY